MKTTPKLTSIIKNDISIFMCIFPPIIFSILITFLFLKSEINKDQYTLIETTYLSFTILLAIPLCFWPFMLWWLHLIKHTFKTGIEITAQSKKMNLKYVLGLGIEYSFECQGKKIKHIASLVSNKRTNKLASEEYLKIIYNPQKGVSFIKELYC